MEEHDNNNNYINHQASNPNEANDFDLFAMYQPNMFLSVDSVGSVGLELANLEELFRTTSSAASHHNASLDTKPAARSRSGSLETVGSDGGCKPLPAVSLHSGGELPEFSLLEAHPDAGHEAASLANAGWIAEEAETKQEEPELQSLASGETEESRDEETTSEAPESQQVSITGSAKSTKKRTRKVYEPAERVYVNPTDADVLCQRGGMANTHEGNKRFRVAKDELQQEYFDTPKLKRTVVSQKLVDMVHQWRGRFVRKDSATGKWYEVHNHVARTKAGQALRETYTAEERADKRAKYAKKKKAKRQQAKK